MESLFDVWRDPFIPKLLNLRRDPYERADTDSNSYNLCRDHKIAPLGLPAAAKVQPFLMSLQKFLSTFQKFPPRQRPASFSIDQMTAKRMPPKGKQLLL